LGEDAVRVITVLAQVDAEPGAGGPSTARWVYRSVTISPIDESNKTLGVILQNGGVFVVDKENGEVISVCIDSRPSNTIKMSG